MAENPNTNQEAPHPYMQTYKGDLDKALDTTEASVVQTLLHDAKEREQAEHDMIVSRRQRGWYTAGALILSMFAIAALGYGIYYFRHLTVPVTPSYSVGVFPQTKSFSIEESSPASLLEQLTTTKSVDRPMLVPLTTNNTVTTDPTTIFTFVGVVPNEPFVHSMSVARIGVVPTGDTLTPFVILATPDPVIGRKEFLIAENKLTTYVSKLFYIPETGLATTFESAYFYNLPTRVLRTVDGTPALLYANVSDTITVITTKPEALKAVYEVILKER